jgi:hypothetical protein
MVMFPNGVNRTAEEGKTVEEKENERKKNQRN